MPDGNSLLSGILGRKYIVNLDSQQGLRCIIFLYGNREEKQRMELSSNKNQMLFEEMRVPKALATLAIPTIISQLITFLYNLADAYFVGRTGNAYMIAAVSLVYPVFSMTSALANLFGVGGGSLISRLLGAKEEGQARKVCLFSVFSSVAVAALFSSLCFLFLNPLLLLLGASSQTIGYARQYMLYILVYGGVPTVLSATMAHLLRSIGYARHASIGLILSAAFDFVFDPVFMFVIFPEGQEVIGCAVATMLSGMLAAVYFMIVFLKLKDKTILCMNPKLGFPEKENIISICSVGLPSALTVFLYQIANVFLNALMSKHGDSAVAALGIVLKAERLPLDISIGLCQGMLPLIAYNYASKRLKRMNDVVNVSRYAGIAIAAVSIFLYEMFSGGVIRIFISTSGGNTMETVETVAQGIQFIRYRCLAAPFAFMNFHITYTLQAMGDGKTTLLLAVLRQCLFYIPIMFVMNSLLGAQGLVMTQFISEIMALCIAFSIFRKKKLMN
ncbi:MAG TPA: MATE family efflux transporter [Lachnospiraceae bacterium]|nr:MATE family efflux transporter [Lachnospiraceae bacterium]